MSAVETILAAVVGDPVARLDAKLEACEGQISRARQAFEKESLLAELGSDPGAAKRRDTAQRSLVDAEAWRVSLLAAKRALQHQAAVRAEEASRADLERRRQLVAADRKARGESAVRLKRAAQAFA